MSKITSKRNRARRNVIVEAHRTEIDRLTSGLKPRPTVERFLFADPRPEGTLKLTEAGFHFLQAKYPTWSVKLPDRVTMADYRYLMQVSTFPYFLDFGTLVTFDPNLGCMAKLVDADFTKLRNLLPPS